MTRNKPAAVPVAVGQRGLARAHAGQRWGMMPAVRPSLSARRVEAVLGSLLVLSVAFAGCGDCGRQPPPVAHDARAASAERSPPRRVAAIDLAPTQPPPLTIEQPKLHSISLSEAGKGRRQTLRYRPQTASGHALRQRVALETRSYEDGWGELTAVPAFEVGLSLAPIETGSGVGSGARGDERGDGEAGRAAAADDNSDSAADDDDNSDSADDDSDSADDDRDSASAAARLRARGLPFRLVATAPPAGPGQALAEALEQRYQRELADRQAELVLDDRGRLVDFTLVVEPGADDGDGGGDGVAAADVRAAMQQLVVETVVPLPEEPVGVGARWRVSMILQRGGALVEQHADYELLAVEAGGRRLKLRADIRQDGQAQRMSAAGLPPGATLELVALMWRARGELTVDLNAPTPAVGTLSFEYRLHRRLVRGPKAHDSMRESTGTINLRTERL